MSPAAPPSIGQYSIQLSYGRLRRIIHKLHVDPGLSLRSPRDDAPLASAVALPVASSRVVCGSTCDQRLYCAAYSPRSAGFRPELRRSSSEVLP
jgi:hypothetical protein